MIRQAKMADAQGILTLRETLVTETQFMLHEPGEEAFNLSNQEAILADFISSTHKVFWVVEMEGAIVGFCVGLGSLAKRNKHNLYCVMGVLQAYTGQGLGALLLDALESWAQSAGFSRIELTVMAHNHKARKLYLKQGFEEEGIKRQSLKVDGHYVDEIYMSKLFAC